MKPRTNAINETDCAFTLYITRHDNVLIGNAKKVNRESKLLQKPIPILTLKSVKFYGRVEVTKGLKCWLSWDPNPSNLS